MLPLLRRTSTAAAPTTITAPTAASTLNQSARDDPAEECAWATGMFTAPAEGAAPDVGAVVIDDDGGAGDGRAAVGFDVGSGFGTTPVTNGFRVDGGSFTATAAATFGMPHP